MSKTVRILLYAILFIFTFWPYLCYMNDVGTPILPEIVTRVFRVLAIVSAVAIIYQNRSGKYFPLVIYLLVLFFFAFFQGLINRAGQQVDVNGINDFTICLFLIVGIMLCFEDTENIATFLKVTLIGGCGLSLFELLRFDTSIVANLAIDRGGLWDLNIFYCASTLWASLYFVIYSLIYKKSYSIAILAWLLAMVINAIATKRMFIVQSIWVVILMMLFYYKTSQIKNFKNLLIFSASAIAVIFAIQLYTDFDFLSLFESQKERLSETTIDSGNSRVLESQTYFSHSSPISWIIGSGLGVPHHGLGADNTALHIGINNYIFKFGIFLLVPFLFFAFKGFNNFRRVGEIYEQDKWQSFCVMCMMADLPVFLFIGNYWAMTPAITFFWYFLVRSNNTVLNDGVSDIK